MFTSQDGTTSLKHEVCWSKDEDDKAIANDKALNDVFSGVEKNICAKDKKAWEILNTTHEGTTKGCMSRLQILTTKFENPRMMEDESISDFNICLRDIANNSIALGEKMS